MIALAPVELLVFAFDDHDSIPGPVADALDRLRGRGLWRVLDLLVVAVDADSGLRRVSLEPSPCPEALAVGSALWHLLGGETGDVPLAPDVGMPSSSGQVGLDLEMLEDLAQRLKPNTTALLVLVERCWTADLQEAVRRMHGVPVVQALLAPETMLVLGPHLAAAAAVEADLELTAAVTGSALLDELAGSDDTAGAIAADVVRALVGAGMIHDADVLKAVGALSAANLVSTAAIAKASRQAHEVAGGVGRIPKGPRR